MSYFDNADKELKVDSMFKRSQGKKKLSTINYKERVFVLTPKQLQYYEGTPQKRGKMKGTVDLIKVKVVEAVDDNAFDKQYCFQVVYQEYTLYIIANNEEQQSEWIYAIQEECRKNKTLLSYYHPGAFIGNQWTCCHNTDKQAMGCQKTFVNTVSNSQVFLDKPLPPLPPTPLENEGLNVVALYSFQGIESGDLSFSKGDEFTILISEGEHWCLARDRNGQKGYIPVNYVREKGGLDTECWYFGDIMRHVAEDKLIKEQKEGTFLVRNSSKDGLMTLSLLHAGVVKHYHIKQDENKFYKISPRHCFPTIPELIEYHKLNSGGLVTRLRQPPSSDTNPPTVGLGHGKWEIDRSEINLGHEIGNGQFGRVCKGWWRGTTEVAVKMMKPNSMSEDDFIEEAKVMQHFHHPNLVQLYGVCSQTPIYIITEFVPNGCLLTFLRKQRSQKLSVLCEIVFHVASAMAYLESKNFIHRDLAARNCLVGMNLVVKVCDFGLSRFVIDDEYTASEGTKFPIKWAAPEVIMYNRFSSKSDIWAYGILMWEVFSGGMSPYASYGNPQVVSYIMSGKRLKKPESCRSGIYTIMKDCWLECPDHRPSFGIVIRRLKSLLGEDYADAFD
ncbi:cytoplasmic tyrosine-protein kinase BMX-like [Xenia sp. Carnegie-2017]|uniref:cytoplasmic tyrosine-protein kinase BMX-like n=1 Tax=Xenia sp. Carnegie-2017 TaxID=2897299 RepID=UPI001F04302E|nr:cytoplasmic tyrosine-protein kinase BMX-like [Xenia sp. Carnegie-2017]